MDLVYVNRLLIIGIATQMIGSEVQVTKSTSIGTGFNWLIQGQVEKNRQESYSININDMLPETIAEQIKAKLPDNHKFDSIEKLTKEIYEGNRTCSRGETIQVTGVIQINNLAKEINATNFDPFNPPNLEIPTFSYYGSTCFSCTLRSEGLNLLVYFNEEALALISYCQSKVITLLGVLSWVPYYKVGKGREINQVINGAAIWVE